MLRSEPFRAYKGREQVHEEQGGDRGGHIDQHGCASSHRFADVQKPVTESHERDAKDEHRGQPECYVHVPGLLSLEVRAGDRPDPYSPTEGNVERGSSNWSQEIVLHCQGFLRAECPAHDPRHFIRHPEFLRPTFERFLTRHALASDPSLNGRREMKWLEMIGWAFGMWFVVRPLGRFLARRADQGVTITATEAVQLADAFDELGVDRVRRGLQAEGHDWTDCFLARATDQPPSPARRAWSRLDRFPGISRRTTRVMVRVWDRKERAFRNCAAAWLAGQRAEPTASPRDEGPMVYIWTGGELREATTGTVEKAGRDHGFESATSAPLAAT